MIWEAYRCTTPGCWPRGIAGVMDLFSACARWDDLQVSTADLAVIMTISRPTQVVVSFISFN